MKKPFVCLTLAAAICLMLFSCAQEEIMDNKNPEENIDNLQGKFAPPPDLIIETYFTDIQFQSTLCTDTLLATTHCDFGDAARNFNASVLIRNIGAGSIPAGTIEVRWKDSVSPNVSFTTVSHNGLAPQGTVVATRSYYVGPCDCVSSDTGGENCFIHSYSATVDPSNLIAESNESNNDSDVFDTCDGCGPCELPVAEPLNP